MKEVVNEKILKWLDVGVIYPISDSAWVSPLQVVPKKGGMIVVKNENNELIPSKTVTLAGHSYYCFLDGYSGYHQIEDAPEDEEKTTFTCPYDTWLIKDFSKILKSLYTLLMNGVTFDFNEECLNAFKIDNIFRSSYYASGTLNDAQLNYATTEKDLLTIVYAFAKFRSYLICNKVIVYTDHSAIKYLITKKDAKPPPH
ncbi:uncharacterized protein LOC133785315 [Humulus lupulus]|uniref:uncharacterized protein LOC133785315 n=1 Tax=Humulus lupulus TaxID=3486 RepID=UPI002B407E2F|nr:uncharacterized protein LOC133785315 [Humulus lupulus]